jgi:hypothetical protein
MKASPVHLRGCLGLAVLAAVGAPAAADDAPAAQPSPPAYTLFLGLDLSVQHGDGFYRVEDIKRSGFVIRIDGEPVRVSAMAGSVQMKLAHVLRLATTSATVDGFNCVRAYTPENDPRRKFEKAAEAGTIASDEYNTSRENVTDTMTKVGNGTLSGSNVFSSINTMNQEARDTQAVSDIATRSAQNLDPASDTRDALDITFKLASEVPLEDPYVIIVAQYSDPGGKPGVGGDWIYAGALDPVRPKPRWIHVFKGGLPPGFKLESVQLHLYDGNTEVATNVASNRMSLTRDEAFEYLAIDYSMQHKGETLPAVPAEPNLPADLRVRVPADQLARPYYVQVSAQGKTGGIFLDEHCTRPIANPYLESVIRGIRFNPSLDNGHLADGVAVLRLDRV